MTRYAGSGRRRRRANETPIYSAALPSTLPGLVAWHEAEDLALADGAPIDAWPNRAIPALPAAAVGAARPTLKLNSFGALPAVDFSGVQWFRYSGAALNWFSGVPGGTVLVVIRPTTLAFGQVFNFLTFAVSGRFALQISNPGQAGANFNVVSQSPDGASPGPTNKFTDPAFAAYIAGEAFLLGASADVPAGIIYSEKNGVQTARTTVANGGAGYAPNLGGFSAAASLGGSIGARDDGNAAFVGQIAAVVAWNRPYTHTELAGVIAYLKKKYRLPRGIPVVLDSFNRANAAVLGNADTGQAYTNPFGPGAAMAISGNRASFNGLAFSLVDTGLNDYSVEFDIPVVGTKPIIGIRGADGANNLQLFSNGVSGSIQLIEFVGAGYPNPVLLDSPGLLQAGDHVEIICKGSQLTLLINGVFRAQASTGHYPVGRFIGIGNNGTLTEYDNLVVSPA